MLYVVRLEECLMRLILVLFLSVFIMSCTRSLDDKTGLKLVIPASSKLQAQQTTMYPMFAAVSVHYSDRPTISRSFELKDRMGDTTNTTGTTTTDLEIFVPSIAQGSNALVQLLVVYEDPNSGALEFNYGDVVSNIAGGENLLDITVVPIGTSTQDTLFAGRYLTGANQGPTGMVSMMLHPPNGKPAMEVEKEPINNGWFQFFHPGGGAEISYVIKAQQKVLFAKLTETSTEFTTGPHLLKLQMPAHQSKDGFGYYRSEIATDLYYGFFKDPNSTISLTGYQVCYPNRQHAVPGAYLTALPSFDPLIYDPTGTAGANVIISGGTSKTFAEIYNANLCDISSGTNLVLHSEKIGNHGLEDYALGALGPFAMINPFQNHDSAFVNSNATTSSIDLNWSYLPGVLGSSITGTTVFAKYDSYGGGGDYYDDFNCREQAELDGMVAIEDTNAVSYSYVGGGGLPSPTDSSVNIRDFKFMLCPYKELASGERLYGMRGVSVYCIGGCNEPYSYGFGYQDQTISTVTTLNSLGQAYGAQVTGYTVNQDSISLTTTNPWGTTAFVAGDEVVLNVVAAGSDGQCNTTGTENIGPGYFLFTRVLSIAPLNIPRNSKIESIDNTELAVMGRTPVDNFCLLTITKVLQFKNLNLSSELTTVQSDIVNSKAQNIFIKISGNLTLSGTPSINATGKGFLGGAVGGHGGGVLGVGNPSNQTFTGGQPYSTSGFAGGGASFGAGGINVDGVFAQGLNNNYGMYMGGGGAGDLSTTGKNGGGLVYITARHLDVQANTSIQADGLDASASEGAGAGGNIWFLFDEVTNPNAFGLTFSAQGGYAGTSGAGGGGLIKGQVCNPGTSSPTFINNGGGTTGSFQQEGAPGNDTTIQEDTWACEN